MNVRVNEKCCDAVVSEELRDAIEKCVAEMKKIKERLCNNIGASAKAMM